MAEETKLVCTLPIDQAPGQLTEWRDLAGAVVARKKLPNGVEVDLPARLASATAGLAAREAACCAFLNLTVTEAADVVRLRITSDILGADQVIAMLVGVAP